MNKQTEALKLALKALEQARGALAYVAVGNATENPNLARSTCSHGVFKIDKVEPVIREALAEQPAIKQDLTPEQPDMNLNCKSVQARLAASWGYVKAEQQAQQCVACEGKPSQENNPCAVCGKPAPVAEPREPQREPVAVKHMMRWVEGLKKLSDNGQHMKIPSGLSAGTCWELAIELEQFLTSPPANANAGKPWVGLTDEEVKHEWVVWRASIPRYMGFAKGIEAKLKAKNSP